MQKKENGRKKDKYSGGKFPFSPPFQFWLQINLVASEKVITNSISVDEKRNVVCFLEYNSAHRWIGGFNTKEIHAYINDIGRKPD